MSTEKEINEELKKFRKTYQMTIDSLKLEINHNNAKQLELLKVVNIMADTIAARNLIIDELISALVDEALAASGSTEEVDPLIHRVRVAIQPGA